MSHQRPLCLAVFLTLALTPMAGPLVAQEKGPSVQSLIEARQDRLGALAHEIWELAEVGYQEVESAALLQAELRSAGFSVEAGVAGMPTAFVAEWGSGSPVIGILAEFESQRRNGWKPQALPERSDCTALRLRRAAPERSTWSEKVCSTTWTWRSTGTRETGTVRVQGHHWRTNRPSSVSMASQPTQQPRRTEAVRRWTASRP